MRVKRAFIVAICYPSSFSLLHEGTNCLISYNFKDEKPVPKVVILGTSAAVPDEKHENTHMVVVGEAQSVLIDCVSSPIIRLRKANVEPNQVTDMILTHFHPDHASGVPLLLMDMWLLGRTLPLHIYGLQHTLERVEKLMDLYDWGDWPNFFPVSFHYLPETEMALVLESREFRIFASPVRHLIPTIGLRIEFLQVDKAMAYSCDTEPSESVVKLAAGVDLLIHEATGASQGHSSAAQAGSIAHEAEVGSLYLIHYRTGDELLQPLVEEARSAFPGLVSLAQDFMEINF